MRLLSRLARATRSAILELNEEKRKERSSMALPDNSGYVQFSMPELDYYYWIFRNPDLRSSDTEIRTRAWKKFLASDDGRKYTLNPHEGRRTPTHKGIIIR